MSMYILTGTRSKVILWCSLVLSMPFLPQPFASQTTSHSSDLSFCFCHTLAPSKRNVIRDYHISPGSWLGSYINHHKYQQQNAEKNAARPVAAPATEATPEEPQFPKFGQLGEDIQFQIWKYAMQTQRVVEVVTYMTREDLPQPWNPFRPSLKIFLRGNIP
jgi:hypothetical protein